MKASIRIPSPCGQPWNAMGTREGGRFCTHCQHTVMDLSRHTDRQLLDLLRHGGMPKCARFTQGQLDRVLGNERPRHAPLLLAAALSGSAALSTVEMSAQPPPPPLVGEVSISRDINKDDGPANTGDADAQEQAIPHPADSARAVDMQQEKADSTGLILTGRVVDENGEPLPFVNITIEGSPMGVASDMEGRFRLSVPGSLVTDSLSLRFTYVGFMPLLLQGVSPKADKGRQTSERSPRTDPGHIELGDVRMRLPVEHFILGGIMVQRTIWYRVTQPFRWTWWKVHSAFR